MTESVLFEIKLEILLQKRFCGSHTIPISDLLYSVFSQFLLAQGITVKLLYSRHLRFRKKCPLCTGVHYVKFFL